MVPSIVTLLVVSLDKVEYLHILQEFVTKSPIKSYAQFSFIQASYSLGN